MDGWRKNGEEKQTEGGRVGFDPADESGVKRREKADGRMDIFSETSGGVVVIGLKDGVSDA